MPIRPLNEPSPPPEISLLYNNLSISSLHTSVEKQVSRVKDKDVSGVEMPQLSNVGLSDLPASPRTPRINADLVEEVALGDSQLLNSDSYFDIGSSLVQAVRTTELDERCPEPM